jgi:hypothetical protein
MIIATTQQIQRLEFPCGNGAHEYYCDCFLDGHRGFGQVCKWLRMLREEGSIESYPVRRFKSINQGLAHTLAASAERLMLQEMLDPSTRSEQRSIKRRVRARHVRALKLIASSKMLEHHLFSNDLMIWFYLSLSDPSLMDGESLLDEWEVHMPPTSKLPVIPDLFFKIVHYSGRATLYVEADRGTETTLQLSEKFTQYRSLLARPESVLLFVEESYRRDTKRLFELAANHLPHYGPPRLLHTVYDHHKHLNLFAQSIWSLSCDSKCSLRDWMSLRATRVG